MDSTYAIAHYLTFVIPNVAVQYRFQNFYIGENVNWVNGTHSFLPFGFSGVTVDRNGGNIESSLIFPNTDLSREWAAQAIEQFWIAKVRVVRVDPTDSNVAANNPDQYRLYNYSGQVSAGVWDDTKVVLSLTSVIDSVRSNVPNRRLNRQLCGHLPTTNRITV